MSVFVKQFWLPSLRQMFYGIYKPSDIINIPLLLRSKQMYTVLLLGNTTAILSNCRKKEITKFLSSLENLSDGLINKKDIAQL